MPAVSTSKLMQIRTVAAELACSREQVYLMIRRGLLEAVRLGPRGLRITRDSLDKYLTAHRVDPQELELV